MLTQQAGAPAFHIRRKYPLAPAQALAASRPWCLEHHRPMSFHIGSASRKLPRSREASPRHSANISSPGRFISSAPSSSKLLHKAGVHPQGIHFVSPRLCQSFAKTGTMFRRKRSFICSTQTFSSGEATRTPPLSPAYQKGSKAKSRVICRTVSGATYVGRLSAKAKSASGLNRYICISN